MTSQNIQNSSMAQRYQSPMAVVNPFNANDGHTNSTISEQGWPPVVPARRRNTLSNNVITAAVVASTTQSSIVNNYRTPINSTSAIISTIVPDNNVKAPLSGNVAALSVVAPNPTTTPVAIPTMNSGGTCVNQNNYNNRDLNNRNNQAKYEVKLNSMPWFHGKISREQAEKLLMPRIDGQFLVRESTNFPGDYTLCVCWQNHVEHYRVKYRDNHLTIDDEEFFENLGQLIEHYQQDADGLCTQLTNCLPKQQDYIDTKLFADAGWIIQERELELREPLGKGEFGEVFLGILRGEKVAVKMLKDSSEAAQKVLSEASLMTSLRHENLVQLMGLIINNRYICLVTEFMSKGSLVDYLRSRGRLHVTKKDQINFAYDAASGMEYLEMRRVVHRDLAARNVLIAGNGTAKVSDFGLARTECVNSDASKLPIKWTAPEALKLNKFSNKSDMWSFGVLLWEIYSFGRVPYPRIPLADVVKHVEKGYKMEAPEGCPPEIYEMMRQSWELSPEKRPTFREVKIKLAQLKSSIT